MSLLLCNWGQIWPNFQGFFFENLFEVKKILIPTRKNKTLDYNLNKFQQNLWNFYYIKFCDAFFKLENENLLNFIR